MFFVEQPAWLKGYAFLKMQDDKNIINSITGGGAIMRRARAAFCGRRRKIATTYGCLRYLEATVRYGCKKCQDTTLRPRVPPPSNVPDRRATTTSTIASVTTKPAPPPCRRSMSLESLDIAHPCNSVLSLH